jgi:hypothetical protein
MGWITTIIGLISSVLKVIGFLKDKPKEETIKRQQQEIADLKTEGIENESDSISNKVKQDWENKKAQAGDDIDERLENIKEKAK